jgi:hypothetical protein
MQTVSIFAVTFNGAKITVYWGQPQNLMPRPAPLSHTILFAIFRGEHNAVFAFLLGMA